MTDETAPPRPAALVDVTCHHCHRRFGFAWPLPENVLPRCPGCGKQREVSKLDELMASIDEFEAQEPLTDELARRVSMGATMDQLATLTGVERSVLRAFLVSAAALPPDAYQRACAALGIDP